MAYVAMRGSAAVNGVSRLHGDVSRQIFQSVFPRRPTAEVPIGHVTNGIHTPSWESTTADELRAKRCGEERWRQTSPTLERDIARASDAELWSVRGTARQALVDYARERIAQQAASPNPLMHDPARSPRNSSGEEVADRRRDLCGMCFQREVPGVEEADDRTWNIALEGLSA